MSAQEHYGDPTHIRHVIGAGGSFSLHNVSGDISVRGVDGDEVRVIATSSHGSKESLPLNVRQTEGGLHIELDQGAFGVSGIGRSRGSAAVDFDCEVPRDAHVEINGVSSDVTVAGLGGEQAFKSVSGDIDINGHGGRISINSVSGDVDLRADEAVAADLTTTSGDVQVKAPMLNDLQLRTVSGDTDVRAAFAPGPEHSVESVSGDLRVESLNGLTIDVKRGMDSALATGRRKVFGDGAAHLRFRSLSGDLDFANGLNATATGTPPPPPVEPPVEPSASSLEILRALERGEIDVDEATRRLEGAPSNG